MPKDGPRRTVANRAGQQRDAADAIRSNRQSSGQNKGKPQSNQNDPQNKAHPHVAGHLLTSFVASVSVTFYPNKCTLSEFVTGKFSDDKALRSHT